MKRSPRPTRRPRLALVALEDRTTPATFVVTTAADNGDDNSPTAGSLRAAFINANATAGLDDITFNIPGTGVHVLTLAASLPGLVEPVRILGYTQPGSAENTLADGNDAKIRIQIDGAGTFVAIEGIVNDMSGTLIEGLSVVNINQVGIRLDGAASKDVVIRGNFIGVTAAGAELGNASTGLSIGGSTGVRVGGPNPGDRNVISGNGVNGIDFFPTTAGLVQGNYIGTDPDGTKAVPNQELGVAVLGGASHSVVGNVISGNKLDGLFVGDFVGNTKVLGNRIGTDRTGTLDLGNGRNGFLYFGGTGIGHQIGGTDPADRNIVSGNEQDGIEVFRQNTVIQGNHVGTNAAGDAALPNGFNGLEIGEGVTVGGTAPGAGNLISGNSLSGISASTNVIVQGNRIGTDAAGTGPLGNGVNGIEIVNGLAGALVGGTAAGAANVIAFNGKYGVTATGAIRNTFSANSIHSNADKGIRLEGIGNSLQAAPDLATAKVTGTTLSVTGTLTTVSGKFRIEFFASPAADPSGFGEGQIFLGGTDVTTKDDGTGTFVAAVAASFDVSGTPFRVITATATNTATGDTSEFSNALTAPTVGGKIAGSVFDDANGNKARDAGEAGLGGVTVFLDSNGDGKLTTGEPTTTSAAASGDFMFTVTADGNYTVRIQVPADKRQTTANPGPVTVAGGQTVGGVIFGLARATEATVTGVVFDDLNNNQAQDVGEPGVAGFTVYLDDNKNGTLDTGELTAVTDANGTYSLTAMEGLFTVRLAPRVGFVQTTVSPTGFLILGGKTIGGLNFGVRSAATTATIRGFIYEDRNRNGVRDAGEPGISGGTVFFDLNGNGSRDAGEPNVATQADGSYFLTTPAPGAVQVHADPSRFKSEVITPNPVVLTVAPGEVRDVDFGVRIVGPVVIRGSVFNDANGNGIRDAGEGGVAGVTAVLDSDFDGVRDANEIFDITLADGSYLFNVGSFQPFQVLVVPPDGFVTTTPNPVPGSGGLIVPPVGLRAGTAATATVRGFVYDDANRNGVRDAGEAPVGGIIFLDQNGNGAIEAGEPSATAQGDGSYSLAVPTPGTVQVRFLPIVPIDVITPNPVTLTVAPGEVRDVDFGTRNVNNQFIRGTVFNDANGNGVRDAGEGGVAGAIAFVDFNGNGTLDTGEPSDFALPADGSYILNLTTNGTFLVRVIPPAGFAATTPNPVAVTLPRFQSAVADPVGLRTVPDSTAFLRGTVYGDANGNGTRDGGELAVPGVTVYLDANDNRQLDDGEARVASAGDGSYQFVVAPGTYRVRAVRPTFLGGQRQTTADPAAVVAAANQEIGGLDFGFQGAVAFRARKGLVGWERFAVGPGAGSAQVNVYDGDPTVRFTAATFQSPGGVRVAVGDVTGDDVPDVLVGAGPGGPPRVTVVDGSNGQLVREIETFEASFTGGVFVAVGDFDGDGFDDTVVTPDQGGGPRVVVRSGRDGSLLADFFGIDDPNFRGGARAAVGDVNGDGVPDLVIAAGFQGGPRVAVFDGQSLRFGVTPVKLFNDFFAFEQTLRNGVFVAAGDLDGDGKAEVIAGGGPGGGPRVTAFGATDLIASGGGTLTQAANFFGGNEANRGGIRVAVKDLDGDNRADVVVGAGEGAGSRVTAYLGKNVGPAGTPAEAFAFDAFPGLAGGVFVG